MVDEWVLGELQASGTPGVSVAVINDGDLVVRAAFGQRDPFSTDALEIDAPFYIYSVTKTLIAVAVLRLIERDRVALDEPVQTYLIDLPIPEPVTVRQLLNHTGGLPDYGGMPEYQADLRADPTLPWTDTEFLERTLARGMRFVPGAGWDYSNVGYLILRQLLQRVHAASFRDVLESTIFAPLGLRQTLVAESLADATILTPGWSSYLRADDELENIAPHYHPGWVSHGVVISTAAELATIVDALFAGRLLRPESLAAMKEPVILPFEHPLFRQPAYGLGLMIDTGSPHGLVAGHGGGGPGYSIGSLHFEHVNGSRVTSVALANRDAGDVGLRLAYELAMRVGSLRS